MKEALRSVDHGKVTEFYALEMVMPGLQGIYEHIFGIKFEPLLNIYEPNPLWSTYLNLRPLSLSGMKMLLDMLFGTIRVKTKTSSAISTWISIPEKESIPALPTGPIKFS